MSSFKTSSFVVLVSWRLTASSEKNSRSCTGLRSSRVGRHNVMTGCPPRNAPLRCCACSSPTASRPTYRSSWPRWPACRSLPSGCCAAASGPTSWCRSSSRPWACRGGSPPCSRTCASRKPSARSGSSSMAPTPQSWRGPLTIALRCREAGAQAITLHARTRTQMFSGTADWDEIAALVERLDVPVIGNGDIRTPEDIVAMRRHTGCAGIMIARGSFGNPWIFAQGRDLLGGGRPRRRDPEPAGRFAVALEHARLALRLQGDSRRTALEFRKHFGWYTKGVPGAAELRERLFQIDSMQGAEAIFAAYLEEAAVEVAA